MLERLSYGAYVPARRIARLVTGFSFEATAMRGDTLA